MNQLSLAVETVLIFLINLLHPTSALHSWKNPITFEDYTHLCPKKQSWKSNPNLNAQLWCHVLFPSNAPIPRRQSFPSVSPNGMCFSVSQTRKATWKYFFCFFLKWHDAWEPERQQVCWVLEDVWGLSIMMGIPVGDSLKSNLAAQQGIWWEQSLCVTCELFSILGYKNSSSQG